MKNYKVAIAASIIAAPMLLNSTVAQAEDSDGHWYLGGSTGYFSPDNDRMGGAESGGNVRTVGAQVGYQFNRAWSIESGFQVDAGSQGKFDLKTYDLNFVRHWGDDVRFLVEAGYTHISVGPDSDALSSIDNVGAGWHAGAGVSAFLTDSLELRGVAKVIYTNDERYTDALGTLSLNYHFGQARAKTGRSQSVLGDSSGNDTLPPIQHREPIAVEPAPVVAPVPKMTYTLINFGSNEINVEGQYGTQLDEISSEISSTESRAVIEGHTDSVGAAKGNQYLSEDRAIMVKRELKKRGVNGEDLSTIGYGESRPVADNETGEGRAKNRRVEVKVFDKE